MYLIPDLFHNNFGISKNFQITYLKPCTSASYSAVLFVHSNSNLHERKCLFFWGSIKTQPAPDPSNVLEPSKNKVRKSLTIECESIHNAKSTILQSSHQPVRIEGDQAECLMCCWLLLLGNFLAPTQ